MRILHTSDLHLGKRLNEFSLYKDQKHILDEILSVLKKEKADVLIVAGDVYDKSVPAAEAVELFDGFLTEVSRLGIVCFISGGNHDSAERISFGAKLMSASRVHMAQPFSGSISPVTVGKGEDAVDFWLMPYIRPAFVRKYFPDIPAGDYNAAVRAVIGTMDINAEHKNVLVCHQFVTAAGAETERCDSETVSVGGMDNIDISCFDMFDYTALGHLHIPQSVGRETVRYSGSPLKYSFSEAKKQKSVVLADINKKDKAEIRIVPLSPLHDMRELRGSIDEIMAKSPSEDYVRITLTDEYVLDAMERIRTIFPNIMRLDFENSFTGMGGSVKSADDIKGISDSELFFRFYEQMKGAPIGDAAADIVKQVFREIEEAEI